MTASFQKTIAALLITIGLGAISAIAGTVDIKWEDGDGFTDVAVRNQNSNDLNRFKKEFEPYVERLAEKHIPDGTVLALHIRDVDLAGEFEPWRVNHDVRIVRDIYPPRMEFDYQLLRDGEVVEEGRESISDTDFNYNIGRRFFDEDEFFYEKEMFSEWVRQELASGGS